MQKTELNRCTATEICLNKNENARTTPVVHTNRRLHKLAQEFITIFFAHKHTTDLILQGGTKKLAHPVLYASTSSNIDRFSNLFHCQNQENICK